MTQKEIIKRSYEVYPETLNDDYPSTKEYLEAKARAEDKRISYIKGLTEGLRHGHNEGYIKGRKEAFIPAHELGLPKSFDHPKIKGWVIRNRPNVSPSLQFFYDKPIRGDNGYGDKFWYPAKTWSESISIPARLFPNLRWEDEPIEVELIIRKV